MKVLHDCCRNVEDGGEINGGDERLTRTSGCLRGIIDGISKGRHVEGHLHNYQIISG